MQRSAVQPIIEHHCALSAFTGKVRADSKEMHGGLTIILSMHIQEGRNVACK